MENKMNQSVDIDPAEYLQIIKKEDDYDETLEVNSANDYDETFEENSANANAFLNSDASVFEIFHYDSEDDEQSSCLQNDMPMPMQNELLEPQTGLNEIETGFSQIGQLNKVGRKYSQLPTIEEQELSQQNLYCEENDCNCKSFLPDEITSIYNNFSSWSVRSQHRYLQSRICFESSVNTMKSTVKFYLSNAVNAVEVCRHFFKSVYRLPHNKLNSLIRKASVNNDKLKIKRRMIHEQSEVDDKLKRKRKLTNARVKKHRQKKRAESQQLNSSKHKDTIEKLQSNQMKKKATK